MLGDFLVWLDAAKELRALYPREKHQITLLGNQGWCALAEQTDYFDEVWRIDRRKFVLNPVYRYRLLRKVRQEGFAVVINPVFTRDFLLGDIVVRASGASQKIGYHGDASIVSEALMRVADKWYTQIVHSRPGVIMELERNADFVRGLGASEFLAGLPELPGPFRPPAALDVTDYYILVPGAGQDYRQWPLENFAQIARNIYQHTGWTGIIIGGHQDQVLGQRLKTEAGVPIQDWTGQTSLMELIGLIAHAKIVVSNETGAVQAAAPLGTPVVCVMGGGHYGRYLPYRTEKPMALRLPVEVHHPMPCFDCDWHCIYKVPPHQPKPCVTGVSVDAVWTAVHGLLPSSKQMEPRQGT